jgi:short-subunit dehydrogenase
LPSIAEIRRVIPKRSEESGRVGGTARDMIRSMKRTALITGASSGIGLDLAHVFAKEKWDVVLVARTEARLREVAAAVEQQYGVAAHVVVADLARRDAPGEIMATLGERGIEVDALVNNAGFGLTGTFAETDLAAELEMIQVNIAALTHLTKLALRPMVACGRGWIMNVASTASFQPGPLMAVYYATKAYVLSFSEAIADELRATEIKVSALCPGPTETGFAAAAKMESSRLFNMARPARSADVARIGYEGLMRGDRVVIPGLRNKLLTQSVRVTPRRLVTAIVRRMQESRQ